MLNWRILYFKCCIYLYYFAIHSVCSLFCLELRFSTWHLKCTDFVILSLWSSQSIRNLYRTGTWTIGHTTFLCCADNFIVRTRTYCYNYLCTYDLQYTAPCVMFLMWADILCGQVAKPPPTFPSNGSVRIKNHYAQGRINHRCIGGFMYKSPRVILTGCKGVS